MGSGGRREKKMGKLVLELKADLRQKEGHAIELGKLRERNWGEEKKRKGRMKKQWGERRRQIPIQTNVKELPKKQGR